MSRTFDILCNDTEFVFNNMGFQAYGTNGGDRAVLLRIMQIVTPHAWCLLTYMKSQSKNNRIPVNIAVVCRAQISAPKCRHSKRLTPEMVMLADTIPFCETLTSFLDHARHVHVVTCAILLKS